MKNKGAFVRTIRCNRCAGRAGQVSRITVSSPLSEPSSGKVFDDHMPLAKRGAGVGWKIPATTADTLRKINKLIKTIKLQK